MANGHGGHRPGADAPVSGPGELAQRTDSSNPILEGPSTGYGDKVALQRQAAAAPMGPPPGPPGAGGGRRPMPPSMLDPTRRPDEPITAGAATGPGAPPSRLPPDEDEALKVLYQLYPSDDLRALLEQRRYL